MSVSCSNHSSNHFGILSEKQTQSVIDYHERKGNKHLFEHCNSHKIYNQDFVKNRKAFQEASLKAHKLNESILPDGEIVKVYDCKNTDKLQYRLRRDGKLPAFDKATNEAYDGAVATYLFFKNVYNMKSIDNHNYPLISNVHFQKYYNNAYWNGEQMVYGDGDGKVFNRFTIDIDITGHEQTHGLTQDRAGTALSNEAGGIDYEGEAGGINESLSDIFGILIKQYAKKQTAEEADWLIGKDLIKKNALALRSMKEPGSAFKNHSALGDDSQVASYAEYLQRAEAGPVDPHDASGISNKAFATLAIQIGGHAWEKAGKIFFEVMPHLKHDLTFNDLATLTLNQAKTSYGESSTEYAAFMAGWRAVDVLK